MENSGASSRGAEIDTPDLLRPGQLHKVYLVGASSRVEVPLGPRLKLSRVMVPGCGLNLAAFGPPLGLTCRVPPLEMLSVNRLTFINLRVKCPIKREGSQKVSHSTFFRACRNSDSCRKATE